LEKVAKLREKIDRIDETILLLLKRRNEISKIIGSIKREHGMLIRDPKRENEKFNHILKKATELGLNPEEIKKLYQIIIDMSVKAQESVYTDRNI